MNRSWFRNPFGSSSGGAAAKQDEDDLLGEGAELVVSSSSSASKRKRRKNNKAGGVIPSSGAMLAPGMDTERVCLHTASTSDVSASTSYASSNGDGSNFLTEVSDYVVV
jgi:hypothetical protein